MRNFLRGDGGPFQTLVPLCGGHTTCASSSEPLSWPRVGPGRACIVEQSSPLSWLISVECRVELTSQLSLELPVAVGLEPPWHAFLSLVFPVMAAKAPRPAWSLHGVPFTWPAPVSEDLSLASDERGTSSIEVIPKRCLRRTSECHPFCNNGHCGCS